MHELGVDEGINGRANRPGFLIRVATPVAAYHCPTCRPAIAYPFFEGVRSNYENLNPQPAMIAKSDYAASAGIFADGYGATGWQSFEHYDSLSETIWSISLGKLVGGVIGPRSMVKLCDISDGMSNTYIAGEKYNNPDYYLSGMYGGEDDRGWDSSFGADYTRWVGANKGDDRAAAADAGIAEGLIAVYGPMQHQSGYAHDLAFGSAHTNGMHMAFCDGSVKIINYTINYGTHYRLGVKNDGMVIDGSEF